MIVRHLLDDCRRLVGPAPRRFSILDWAYLNHDPPPWIDETIEPHELSGIELDHAFAFRDQQHIRRNGNVVWGALVQANEVLYKPGTLDTAALVLYSEDPYFDERPHELRQAASQLSALKGTTPEDEALRPLVAAMTAENDSIQHQQLPRHFWHDRQIAATFLFVVRQHLPEGYLVNALFPILVAPKLSPAALVLPSAYWPDDFLEYWVFGDRTALRSTAVRTVGQAATHQEPVE